MMTNNTTSFRDEVLADESSTLGAKLSDTATQVKDKVSDMGRSAANSIDENRVAAASGLEKAAAALHEGDKVGSLAHTAADKLSSTADYVRENNVNRMMNDVGTLVKNNPGPSLLTAAAIGFLVGQAFRRND